MFYEWVSPIASYIATSHVYVHSHENVRASERASKLNLPGCAATSHDATGAQPCHCQSPLCGHLLAYAKWPTRERDRARPPTILKASFSRTHVRNFRRWACLARRIIVCLSRNCVCAFRHSRRWQRLLYTSIFIFFTSFVHEAIFTKW